MIIQLIMIKHIHYWSNPTYAAMDVIRLQQNGSWWMSQLLYVWIFLRAVWVIFQHIELIRTGRSQFQGLNGILATLLVYCSISPLRRCHQYGSNYATTSISFCRRILIAIQSLKVISSYKVWKIMKTLYRHKEIGPLSTWTMIQYVDRGMT